MKRLKDNIMLIILCIVIICCTVSINIKIDSVENEINNKVGYVWVKADSIWWKLDHISSDTVYLRNIEERLHKSYRGY